MLAEDLPDLEEKAVQQQHVREQQSPPAVALSMEHADKWIKYCKVSNGGEI